MKKFSQILEELNDVLDKAGVDEEVLQDEVPGGNVETVAEAPETEPVAEEPEFNDTMSLADKFDAKAKIARALENLKIAVDEFKDATAEKVDLIKDADLLAAIENLSTGVTNVESALAQGDLLKSTLNDPFNGDLQDTDVEVEDEEPTEEDVAEETDEEEATPDPDFNAEAGLDLIKNDEE